MNEDITIPKKELVEIAKTLSAAKRSIDRMIKLDNAIKQVNSSDGYQPAGKSLDTNNPPQGGSGVPLTIKCSGSEYTYK